MNKKNIFLILSLLLTRPSFCLTHDGALKLETPHLQIPEPEDDGRVQTLNKTGAMASKINEVQKRFFDHIKSGDKTILEIGGAYGNILHKAAQNYSFNRYVFADLDAGHVYFAAKGIEDLHHKSKIPLATKAKIDYQVLDFTKDLDTSIKKVDVILASRVFHFFNPEQMDIALNNIKKLLRPGGKVFIYGTTPYVKRYEKFIPEYEKRLKNKEKYPGFVDSLEPYLNTEATSLSQQKNISPKPFMFLDEKVLTNLFKDFSFKIIEAKKIPLNYESKAWQLDGREAVLFIAESPSL